MLRVVSANEEESKWQRGNISCHVLSLRSPAMSSVTLFEKILFSMVQECQISTIPLIEPSKHSHRCWSGSQSNESHEWNKRLKAQHNCIGCCFWWRSSKNEEDMLVQTKKPNLSFLWSLCGVDAINVEGRPGWAVIIAHNSDVYSTTTWYRENIGEIPLMPVYLGKCLGKARGCCTVTGIELKSGFDKITWTGQMPIPTPTSEKEQWKNS